MSAINQAWTLDTRGWKQEMYMVYPMPHDALLHEFVVGTHPKVAYNVAYFQDGELFELSPPFQRKYLMLRAAISGEEPGKVVAIDGVGTARNLDNGDMYFRIYYNGVI